MLLWFNISLFTVKLISKIQPLKNKTDFDVEKNLSNYLFETTPLMSTYLLAFVVGEYDFLEASFKSNLPIRVYTPVGQSHLGKFSLDVINFLKLLFLRGVY